MKLEAGRQDGTLKAKTSRQQGNGYGAHDEPPLSRRARRDFSARLRGLYVSIETFDGR
jgi:hypothetical protein